MQSHLHNEKTEWLCDFVTCLILVTGRAKVRGLLSPTEKLFPSSHASTLTSASGTGLQSSPLCSILSISCLMSNKLGIGIYKILLLLY